MLVRHQLLCALLVWLMCAAATLLVVSGRVGGSGLFDWAGEPQSAINEAYATTADGNTSAPSSRRRTAPVVVGAGQGTTGTHLFFEATCHLGYPSLHYAVHCNPNDEESFPALLRAHRAAMAAFRETKNDADAYTTNLLEKMEAVILHAKQRNMTLALHDTPYTMAIPHLMEIVKKLHDGRPPIVLLSERDPMQWARRRWAMHGIETVCGDTNSTIDPHTLEGGAFDIIGCVERGMRAFRLEGEDGGSSTVRPPPSAAEFLTSIRNMTKATGRDALARQFGEYQDAVCRIATFSYDMFERENRTEKEELVGLMLEKIGPAVEQFEDSTA